MHQDKLAQSPVIRESECLLQLCVIFGGGCEIPYRWLRKHFFDSIPSTCFPYSFLPKLECTALGLYSSISTPSTVHLWVQWNPTTPISKL